MGSANDLTLAFINKRPAAAARVLASLPADDAAGFIDSIPTRYAVQLVSPLNVRDAVAILKLVNDTTATAIIRDLEFSAATAIVRQLAAADRQALLAGLPRRQKGRFESALTFAPDTVGAHMSTSVDVLYASDTVADALRLKTHHHDSRSTLTLVVNDKRALIGVVPLLAVLRHPESKLLSDLLDVSITAVSPQMRLTRLKDLDVWHLSGELPVISRRGEPIGVFFSQSVSPGEGGYEDGVSPVAESFTEATLQMMGQSALQLADLLTPRSSGRSGPGGSDVS